MSTIPENRPMDFSKYGLMDEVQLQANEKSEIEYSTEEIKAELRDSLNELEQISAL